MVHEADATSSAADRDPGRQRWAAGTAAPPAPSAIPHKWRKRFCACMLAHGAGAYERFMAPRKQALFQGLTGRILEIGAGTGVNLPHLPRGITYIAAEPNPYMHTYLRAAAQEHGVRLDLHSSTIEGLINAGTLPHASLDAVICTLVLCSVHDPAHVTARSLDLLKPGGRFIFIEHVAAPRGSRLRFVQRTVKPAWRIFGDGCHPDRETWRILEQAGFGSLSYERFRAPLPVVGPHIAGQGVKQ